MGQVLALRECHGKPWGFPGKPAPVPLETSTRSTGAGFDEYRCGFYKTHGYLEYLGIPKHILVRKKKTLQYITSKVFILLHVLLVCL
jgi:hypothetical protein